MPAPPLAGAALPAPVVGVMTAALKDWVEPRRAVAVGLEPSTPLLRLPVLALPVEPRAATLRAAIAEECAPWRVPVVAGTGSAVLDGDVDAASGDAVEVGADRDWCWCTGCAR